MKTLFFAALFVAACGTTQATTDASTVCVPGTSIACVGTGGCSGGQACNAQGTGYGACDCGSSDAGIVDAVADSVADSNTGDVDAGPLAPDQIPNLVLWLDSMKGITTDTTCTKNVVVWADQSPHKNNVKNTADPCLNTPTVSLSGYKSFDVVQFIPNGTGQLLHATDDPSLHLGTADFAIAMVIQNPHSGEDGRIWDQGALQLFVYGPTSTFTGSVQGVGNVLQAPLSTSTFHIVVLRGPAFEVRIDGVSAKGTNPSVDLSAGGGLDFGCVETQGNDYPETDYLEIAEYQGTVTDGQVIGLESWLKNKYGL